MGWEKNAEDAAGKVDAATAKESLEDLFTGVDLTRVASEDREAVNNILLDLSLHTSKAERVKAWEKFKESVAESTFTLVKNGASAALKAILCLAVLVMPASAGLVDLDPFWAGAAKASKRSRVGVSINLNGLSEGDAYLPLAWDKKRNYWDLGVGFDGPDFKSADFSPGFSFNLVALGHDALKNILGDRVGLLPIPGLWIGVKITAPPLNDIKQKWDYKDKISVSVTYALFGGSE